MTSVTTVVPARTGLVGHPSDAFGGAVLAMPVPALAATVTVAASPDVHVGDRHFADLESLLAAPHAGDSILLTATAAGLVTWLRDRGLTPPSTGFTMTWSTTVPRSVGLAGSSALVIAALRSLARFWEVDIADDDGPQLALAVEVEGLGIAAGPQDRIVQWHNAPLLMDFASTPWALTEIHPPTPMELLVVWTDAARRPSHTTHAPLQQRRDDTDVVQHMHALGQLARNAAAALTAGAVDEFARLVDEGFEHRRALLALDPAHVELVEELRRLGAAATYTGSGGAVVALAADLDQLRDWARKRGLGTAVATLA